MRWPWKRRSQAAVPRHAAGSWTQPGLPPVEPSVTLGFADGSEVELGESDPAAMALHAVADALVRKEPA